MNRQSAFTLVEIMITIVIVGFLISMALPRYLITLEKAKIAQAFTILTALKDAQILYKYENGAYSAALGDLDITILAPAHFNMPTVAVADPIATIQRATGAYTLTIDADGAIMCGMENPVGICAKVGCSDGFCN